MKLTEKEQKIIDLLLAEGSLSPAEIVKSSGFQKSSVFYIIKKLIEKNVVQKDCDDLNPSRRSSYKLNIEEIPSRIVEENSTDDLKNTGPSTGLTGPLTGPSTGPTGPLTGPSTGPTGPLTGPSSVGLYSIILLSIKLNQSYLNLINKKRTKNFSSSDFVEVVNHCLSEVLDCENNKYPLMNAAGRL